MDKKIALIPAYQPNDVFIDLCKQLRENGYDVIAVDDGSGIECTSIFDRASVYATILFHVDNLGKGHALKTGLIYISDTYPTESVIVTADADGQHQLSDINQTWDKASKNHGSLVLGCRRFGDNTPVRSRIGNALTRVIYQILAGIKISDTQTGLRAFSYDVIPFLLSIKGERYEYEMNVLLECSKAALLIREIPIQTLYIDGNASSHFRPVRDGLTIYKEIARFAGSSLFCFCLDYFLFHVLSELSAGLGGGYIPLSNVLARLVSASVNYFLNKRFVFCYGGGSRASALKYARLGLCILAGNTLVLSLFIRFAGIDRHLAKILTEILFFTISWTVQRTFIFKEQKSRDTHECDSEPE